VYLAGGVAVDVSGSYFSGKSCIDAGEQLLARGGDEAEAMG